MVSIEKINNIQRIIQTRNNFNPFLSFQNAAMLFLHMTWIETQKVLWLLWEKITVQWYKIDNGVYVCLMKSRGVKKFLIR